ncbi:TAXI family TRAP transporter solute-binding subunit [Nocardia sp. CDC159]|uniref:TAXI family TRAP transporter solute-binding subunit n=1 Tax=Nocardia pulmonis TaxID=2951408 RepID=A0A9X2E1V8_9NOCA|nr:MULTISPECIES: TAXI family TRAP transporter solute-binding subunit [Nocardia]MCM6772517.1 TAXI family TRAP transporter solute-binding subunit [Nocardia pulmonis]MCM6784825.1 TAXI family TRAP transporter solute-binding subunit [Nocardia sp. CDC159]
MRTAALVCAVVVATAGLAGCGGRRDAPSGAADGPVTCEVGQDTRIGIATGNATGVYFALGNAYADQISQATGGRVKATAAETGASVQNIQQLVAGTYQVAFSLADTAADAVLGKDSFEGKKQPVRALSRLYPNYTQVVVRTGANIGSLADLRGKRVSTGSPKSGTEVIAQRVLRAAGLDPERDIAAQRLDLTKTVDGMKDGSIDAMFFSGGLPTPGITDLFTSARDRVQLLDISAALPRLREISAVYEAAPIPAATYKLPADVPTVVVPNVLLVRDDLDPNLACVLTKTLYDRKPQLEQANSAAKGISRDTARNTDPVPLHRGADQALS